MRLRLIGGHITATQLTALSEVAATFGDGQVYPTSRANVQVRGLPSTNGALAHDALAAIERTGLLPSRSHELVRNIMVSPLSGIAGGRADLRPLAAQLDDHVCRNPRLVDLPGRFLFVLDDGRGDLIERGADLGAVALSEDLVQLRVGERWSQIFSIDSAATKLAELADEFITVRGDSPAAAWHLSELDRPLAPSAAGDPRLPAPAPALPFGDVPGGHLYPVPESGLDRATIIDLCARAAHVIVTPWRGVFIPHCEIGRSIAPVPEATSADL